MTNPINDQSPLHVSGLFCVGSQMWRDASEFPSASETFSRKNWVGYDKLSAEQSPNLR